MCMLALLQNFITLSFLETFISIDAKFLYAATEKITWASSLVAIGLRITILIGECYGLSFVLICVWGIIKFFMLLQIQE